MQNDPLLLDLYACSSQPSHWPQVLDKLRDETGACSAVVQAIRFDGDQARLLWQATDHRSARHAGDLSNNQGNPRLAPRRSLRGLNRVVRDDQLFDAQDPERELLERQMASMGLGRFLGMLQPMGGDDYIAVALHRDRDDPQDFDDTTSTRLNALAPHLLQTCRLGGQLQKATQGLDLLRQHLDGLRCGLLVCSPDAEVQWMNRRARQITVGDLPLKLQGRQLRADAAAASHRLRQEIACTGETPRFVALGDGERAVHLAMRGCRGADGSHDGSVLVAITRAGDAAQVPVQAWCQLLGVTPAEAALVATLVAGGTLEMHAQQRGVSAGTVRGQLKQVLSKTGTHRQAELVRLALSSAAAHLLDAVADQV